MSRLSRCVFLFLCFCLLPLAACNPSVTTGGEDLATPTGGAAGRGENSLAYHGAVGSVQAFVRDYVR